MFRRSLPAIAATLALVACGVPAARFPSDVQTALARRDMRRLETELLLVYYPDGRRELAERLATRVERCAVQLRRRARLDNRHAREKMVVVVPEAPFNNAYVLPPVAGLEDVAVVPTGNTLDFTTNFGLPPDPGHVGCHEIVHYVHVKQIAGLWGTLRTALGELVSPQVGFDAWFLEGLATYYEAQLQPGTGRPRWPVFTGMFHAAYAGGAVGGGDLSEQKRMSPVGHHYLVGTMFVQYLAETYGDASLWRVIELQARSTSVIFSVNGRFGEVYGKGLPALVGEFRRWVAHKYPVRERPATERVVRRLGDDARWAWGPAGEVAMIDADVDAPTRLRVWRADGALVDRVSLVDLVPPRRQVIAAPLLVSGMSFAADGSLWFTSVDLGGTYQTTRLFRWRPGDRVDEVAHGLGPGGAIAPDGRTYFHMRVDGDRWSLVARALDGGATRVLWDAAPGQYALRLSPSRDGARLAVSVWDGARFAIWVVDAATGARLEEHVGKDGGPVYDGAFTDDGRLLVLEVVDGRFQVAVFGAGGERTMVTDAPYGLIEPRVHGQALRFLARDGWTYTLDEVQLPAAVTETVAETVAEPVAEPVAETVADTVTAPGTSFVADRLEVLDDRPYSRFDGLFRPSLHSFALIAPAVGATQLGLALSGGDRLDLVRWAMAGYIDPQDKKMSGAGGIILNDLAPWVVLATGQRLEFTEEERDDDGMLVATYDREIRDGVVALGREWRGTYAVAAGGAYAYDRVDSGILRLYGPEASVGYAAVESTRAAGIRRGLMMTGSGAWFPRPAGAIRQARGTLDLFAPLPFVRRHVLHAALRGHVVQDAPAPLIAIGGEAALPPLWSSAGETVDLGVGDGVLPGQRRFAEPLRGFEDLPLAAERVALVDLSWRYPFMIDRGLPSLGFLPATFISELELELFLAGAALRPELSADDYHAAAGAALTLHLSLFRVPLAIQYQASRRLTDDRGFLQLVGFGPDL